MKRTALIPAFNEAGSIGEVVSEVEEYVDRVLVVDDGSTDGTAEVSREVGAEVVEHEVNEGYLGALRTGFRKVEGGVVVTLDADGEMDPRFVPDLVEPVESGEADLVLGRRGEIPRASERFLSFVAGLFVDAEDTGTGFRALRGELARRMELRGVCPCGTFVLEAADLGAEISEVPVVNRSARGHRGVAWRHFFQFWYVLGYGVRK